jgi:hypothetical protein
MFNLTEKTLVDIIDKAQKIRTLGRKHIVILAGYTSGSAFLYQRWEDRPPSLRFYGNHFRNHISTKAEISVAEFSYSDPVVLSRENSGDNTPINGIAFGTGEVDDAPGGCLLLYGKPGKNIIYFNNTLYVSGIPHSITLELEHADFWIAETTVMPFLISHNFKLNWKRIKNEFFY